jgi:hypothetical protein
MPAPAHAGGLHPAKLDAFPGRRRIVTSEPFRLGTMPRPDAIGKPAPRLLSPSRVGGSYRLFPRAAARRVSQSPPAQHCRRVRYASRRRGYASLALPLRPDREGGAPVLV